MTHETILLAASMALVGDTVLDPLDRELGVIVEIAPEPDGRIRFKLANGFEISGKSFHLVSVLRPLNAKQLAYREAVAADDAWAAELDKLFGGLAGDVRYTIVGAGKPGSKLRELHDRFVAAAAALRDLNVYSVEP
jgi:hypothetical protein